MAMASVKTSDARIYIHPNDRQCRIESTVRRGESLQSVPPSQRPVPELRSELVRLVTERSRSNWSGSEATTRLLALISVCIRMYNRDLAA